jgi:hypothetical protein
MSMFDDLIPQAARQSGGGIFDDLIPNFNERFQGEPSQAQPNPALASGMQQVARAKTTGPQLSQINRTAVDFLNQGPAAAQRTTANVEAQYPNLVSADVHENDAGQLSYRDATGQMLPVEQGKHITLRDPADGRVKVFRRDAETDEGAISSIGRLAMSGMGAGAPTARAAVGAPAKAIQPQASDIMATAKPHYQAFKAEAGQISVPMETGKAMADRLRAALERVGLTEEMAGAPARSAIALLESGKVQTLDDLQKIKRIAGRGFQATEKDARDAAGALSGEVTKIISQVSGEAGQSLQTADKIHSTALAVQDLQRKANVAELRAGRAGYGGNAVNSMRQVLSPIVQRATEGKTTGFKPDEIQAMREIVEGTTATNFARGVGQLSPSKGIIQTLGGAGAAVALGPGGLVIPALGMAANKVATAMTGNQIARLQELVAKRSPAYADAVSKAAARYERAQSELASNPTPARLASYLSASRALSSGLTRDGIQVTSGDLLRGIQGPMRGAAENENPEPEGVVNQ